MNRHLKKARTIIAFASLFLIFLTGLLYVLGGRLNTSKSIPLGLYWLTKRPIEKGQYVLFCPPQKLVFKKAHRRGYIASGFCPGGYGYMMKRVLAVFNDTVSINQKGVWVNHQLIAQSRPYQNDAQGRVLPQVALHQYTLKGAELLLMTDQSELSFDARYFGLIKRAQIKSVIKPVLTWPSIS